MSAPAAPFLIRDNEDARPSPTIITFEDGTKFTLRPSLGLAITLDRAFGGLPALLAKLAANSLDAVVTVIEQATGEKPDALSVMGPAGLEKVLPAYSKALLRFVEGLVALPTSGEPAKADDGDLIEFAALLELLFGYGTGVLGWSAAETYATSPFDIFIAYRARMTFVGNVLTSVFGAKDDDDASGSPSSDDGLDRAGLAALRGMGGITGPAKPFAPRGTTGGIGRMGRI